jgi:hypothetical protein
MQLGCWRLGQAGHRAAAVMTVSEASSLVQAEVPQLLATDAVLAGQAQTSCNKPRQGVQRLS